MSNAADKPRKIGELLVADGSVDAVGVDKALHAQRQTGGAVGEHLVRLGFVDDTTLLRALTRQTGLQHVDLTHVTIPVDVLRKLKFETVRDRRVLPLAAQGNTLLLGMVRPDDVATVQHVEFESGLTVQPILLSGVQLDEALTGFAADGYAHEPLHLAPRLNESDVGRDLAGMLRAMVATRGQDLYLSDGAIPGIKVDNDLRRLPLHPLEGGEIATLVAPVLSNEQQRRFAERLELDFALALPGVGRFRCNLYRQRGSVSFTARHIVEKIPSLDELGLPPFIGDYALKQQGLILVVGPTGHGKSTTLASMIDVINQQRRANVITIEDPIEYVHHHRSSNVNQREVGTDTHSFAEGLRHVFRQSPDVMVIGELRDHESTSIAMTAAETGHLVLATMHSLNATASVDRIVDLYPANQQHQVRAQLSEALLLVFSQRLVKRAKGGGRVLAWERMSASLRVRNAIREGKVHTLRALMQSNFEELQSIEQSLATLVANGTIAREEAMKYVDYGPYLDDLLRARGIRIPEPHAKPTT